MFDVKNVFCRVGAYMYLYRCSDKARSRHYFSVINMVSYGIPLLKLETQQFCWLWTLFFQVANVCRTPTNTSTASSTTQSPLCDYFSSSVQASSAPSTSQTIDCSQIIGLSCFMNICYCYVFLTFLNEIIIVIIIIIIIFLK